MKFNKEFSQVLFLEESAKHLLCVALSQGLVWKGEWDIVFFLEELADKGEVLDPEAFDYKAKNKFQDWDF